MTMRPYITRCISEAWELIPEYDMTPRSLDRSIREGVGSCANHSTIIGRLALMDGTPALRSVLFGTDDKPSHFSSYLFVDREWVRVSTDKSAKSTYVDADGRMYSPNCIMWARSSYGLLEPISEDVRANDVAELVIPEIAMATFKEATTLDHYLWLARYMEFINEQN